MLENRVSLSRKKQKLKKKYLTGVCFMEKTNKPYDLILPLFLKQCSLIPHCSSLPMNQSKTISGEEMSEKNTKKTSREN